MLVDHSDAGGNGVSRRRPRAFFPINQYLSCVRTKHAIQHLHRRGFTGAIFADYSMDTASLDPKIYPVIGDAGAKAFTQAPQFDRWKCAGHFREVSEFDVKSQCHAQGIIDLTAVVLPQRKSGRGQPHSKTSRTERSVRQRVSVLECGCPLPL
jgi:hypothetical protein